MEQRWSKSGAKVGHLGQDSSQCMTPRGPGVVMHCEVSWRIKIYFFVVDQSGNQQLINNYRPISVLPFFSKIYEKVMANFFINFLDANGILSNFQFGFRHKHSTTHAIITLTERISKSLDTGKIVCGIFIDFKKCF